MDAAEPTAPRSGLLLRVFWTLLALIVVGYPLSVGLLMYTQARWGIPADPDPIHHAAYPIYWVAERVPALQQPLREYAIYCVFLQLQRQPLLHDDPAPAPAPAPQP